MMQPHIAEIAIKRVITEFSSDSHNIFTPFALCNEVLDKIPSLDGTILVVANLEFVYNIVLRGVDASRVFFATPCPKKKKMATAWIPESNIFIYNNVLTKEDVGDMKFDVVVGNPPYQTGDEELRKKKKTGTKPLWFFFVEQAFSLVRDNGYVAFVTPTSWMQYYSNIHKHIVTRRQIASKVFKRSPFGSSVNTTASYWIVQAADSDSSVWNIIDDNEHSSVVDLSKFVPAKMDAFDVKMSILNKTVNSLDDKFPVTAIMTYHSHSHKNILSNKSSAEFKYPIYHTTKGLLWTNKKHDIHGKWKVIIPRTGTMSNAHVDRDSAVSHHAVYCLVNSSSEGENLLTVLRSKLVRSMITFVRQNVTIATDFWRSLPAVDLTRSWTDEELYAHFNLTEEEIKLIEDTIK